MRELAKVLGEHHAASHHNRPTDWVFASTMKNGKVPIWSTSLMEDHVRPAGRRAGITKQLTWKMFRTSIATQLTANGENIKTSQLTLGHANSQIIADVYTVPVASVVRSAHNRLVDMVIASHTLAEAKIGLIGPRRESCTAKLLNFWWAQQDSNLRLPPCEGGTLPLSYAPGTALEATPYSSSIHGVKPLH